MNVGETHESEFYFGESVLVEVDRERFEKDQGVVYLACIEQLIDLKGA